MEEVMTLTLPYDIYEVDNPINFSDLNNKLFCTFTTLEDIDDLGDVGATGIYNNDGDEMESGLAFRFPEDVDDSFKGEEGYKPKPIKIAGKKLMYIEYNI